MKKTAKMLKDESGMALMMAIFTVTVLMVIATEVMYSTNVELVVSASAVNQVKAHYAAKAGVQISLLRIHIYQKAVSLLGSAVPASTLDPIWQTPFAWPPIVPPETSTVDKGEIAKSVKESKMQGQYVATIESEGSKIDINDLDSPSKAIADSTRQQLLNIWQEKMENDENFANRHRGDDFEQVVDNMTDWIDADTKGRGKTGGDESALYPDRPNEFIPPNAPFKTLEEIHMVAGMTDEIFDLLKPRITVYGSKGINVNYAKKDVLMSLSPQITDERADKIITDRASKDRGPFKDENDFVQYLNSIGVQGNPFETQAQGNNPASKIPLLFDPEFNFTVRSTGQAGRVQKEITAVVYDVDQTTARLHDALKSQTTQQGQGAPKPESAQGQGPGTPPGQPPPGQQGQQKKTQVKVPNAEPNIVYWNET